MVIKVRGITTITSDVRRRNPVPSLCPLVWPLLVEKAESVAIDHTIVTTASPLNRNTRVYPFQTLFTVVKHNGVFLSGEALSPTLCAIVVGHALVTSDDVGITLPSLLSAYSIHRRRRPLTDGHKPSVPLGQRTSRRGEVAVRRSLHSSVGGDGRRRWRRSERRSVQVFTFSP